MLTKIKTHQLEYIVYIIQYIYHNIIYMAIIVAMPVSRVIGIDTKISLHLIIKF